MSLTYYEEIISKMALTGEFNGALRWVLKNEGKNEELAQSIIKLTEQLNKQDRIQFYLAAIDLAKEVDTILSAQKYIEQSQPKDRIIIKEDAEPVEP